MDTFFAELARQIERVHKVGSGEAIRRANLMRAAVRDRGTEWMCLTGPAVVATCRAFGIKATPRNIDAFCFMND